MTGNITLRQRRRQVFYRQPQVGMVLAQPAFAIVFKQIAGVVLWSSFFGHADQMVGLCTGGQLGGRAGQRFVLCG